MFNNRNGDPTPPSRGPSIKSIHAGESSMMSVSGLSISDTGVLPDELRQRMDNIGQEGDSMPKTKQASRVLEDDEEEEESIAILDEQQDHSRPRNSHMASVSTEEADNEVDLEKKKLEKRESGNTTKTKPSKNLLTWCLSELECIDEADGKEIDPFSKRRIRFFVFVAVLSVVVNLVVIPLSLTGMEERKKNYTQAPTTAPNTILTPTTGPTTSNGGNNNMNTPSLSPSSSSKAPNSVNPPPTNTNTDSPVPGPPKPTFTIIPPQGEPTQPTKPAAVALPPYTLTALENSQSAQSKAYAWLTADPNLGSYPSSRQLQRMALATLFYATNDKYYKVLFGRSAAGVADPEVFTKLFDDNKNNQQQKEMQVYWTNASNWLSYEIHECFWFSQAPFVCDAQQNYRFLTLSRNGLVGRLPPQLGLLTKLEQLQLSDNLQVYGSIPKQISYLTQLRSLQLNNMPQLSGTIPEAIWLLHASLQELHLRETPYIPKVLSTSLGLLTRLQELLLDTRINTGSGVTSKQSSIPTQMGNMKSLQAFTVTGQELRGTLPTELARLSDLEWLSICHSKLEGSIPTQYGSLAKATNLDLQHNQLGGSMPKELGQIGGALLNLALNDNQFKGSIPFQYSNLTNCKSMAFQHNQLTGSIPLGLCFLKTEGIIHTLKVDCNQEDKVSKSSYPVWCSCDCDCY